MKTIIKILLWLILLILMATVLRGIIEKTIYFIYPLEYEETITEYANENGLDIYYVMAVIKAESNYDPKAHSGKARGLMQITDDTAGWLAGKMGIKLDETKLEDPETNIKMGCYYLKYLSELYSDRDVVSAAYNAGMGNVSKWLGDSQHSADGKTLRDIPFEETRNYVQKVNKYEAVYRKLYPNKG